MKNQGIFAALNLTWVLVILTTAPLKIFAEGTVENKVFKSESVGHNVNVYVYLPEGYRTDTDPYRLYVFLHGGGGDNASANQNIIKPILDRLITNETIEPMVVAWPQVTWPGVNGQNWLNLHMYTNSVRNGNYESLITLDLLAWLEDHYNVSKDRLSRVIGGFSVGACSAARIAIRNSEKFIAFAAHDGYMSLKTWSEYEIQFLLEEYIGYEPGSYVYSPSNGFWSLVMFGFSGAFSPNLDNPNWQVDLPFDEWGKVIPEVYENRWIANFDPATMMQNPEIYKNPLYIYFDTRKNIGLPQWTTNQYANDLCHYELDSIGIDHTYTMFTNNPGHFLGADAAENALLFLNNSMNNAAAKVSTRDQDFRKAGFRLMQNYPNPFNAQTTINYRLDKAAYTKLQILNSMGQKVMTLLDEHMPAGEYQMKWAGRDEFGNNVVSGFYVVKLEIDGYYQMKKMLMLK